LNNPKLTVLLKRLVAILLFLVIKGVEEMV